MALLFAFVAPTVTDAQESSESQAAGDALPAAIPDGPAVSPLVVSLTLERASALLDAALRLGRQHDMLPLTVVVLDSGGHMIALKREDGSCIFRVQVANAKAYGALGMGVSTCVMDQRLADRPVFAGSLSVVSDGQFGRYPAAC